MKREEIEGKVLKIISEYVSMPQDKVEMHHSLQDDLSIDSLGIIEIVQTVEDEYNLSIDPEDLTAVKTVKDAIDHFEKIINKE